MGKKQAKSEAAKQPAEKNKAKTAAAREARSSGSLNDTFKFTGEPNKKVAPQAQTIIDILKENGVLTREKLIEKMDGKVTTRQPLGRILSYYQNLLQEVGSVQLIKVPPAKETAEDVEDAG